MVRCMIVYKIADRFTDDQITFEIVGRDRGVDADSAVNGTVKAATLTSSTSAYNKRHDMSVKVTFIVPGSAPSNTVTLHFFYLPKLDIAVVEAPVFTGIASTHKHAVKYAFSLACLLQPDDLGLEDPRIRGSGRDDIDGQGKGNSSRRNGGDAGDRGKLLPASFFNVKEAGGHAYTWVQSLCGTIGGVPLLFEGDAAMGEAGARSAAASAFDRVVGLVRRRLQVLWEAADALGALVAPGDGRVGLPVPITQKPGRGWGRVVGWKDVADEENRNGIDGLVSIDCKTRKRRQWRGYDSGRDGRFKRNLRLGK
ncbi:hypothetical protein BC830DRAFT_957005 [Chytriomyces sp. MP71]|nr:hypothetical protein BC830DRAFT_957005 [Chytriomyces sp. MP71]